MNQKIKYAALGIALACTGWTGASAEQVYELNPITVTAQRTKTTDLKTPSAVDVLTAEDIQKTGATSVQEALKFTTGIIAHAQGPRNISQGTMTNKIVIRGVEKGTLVLVDGVPINQAGRYNLEDIPTESIEKIEVVRGGGAVLYGSEANGGVVNIITKGKRPNLVKAGFGNYGIQNYALSAQAGKLGFTATYDHTGKIDNVSSPDGGRPKGMYFNIRRGEHANFNARYDFNDKLFISHTYGRNSDHYLYRWDGRAYTSVNSKTHKVTVYPEANAGAPYKNELHKTEENLTTIHYDDGNLKANVFYNRRDQHSYNNNATTYPYIGKKYNYNKKYYDSSSYLDETFGIDVSNRWNFKNGSFMLGYDFQREMEDKTVSDKTSMGKVTPGTFNHYTRNMHSFYGQLAYDFTKSTRANLNLRETWTEADAAGNKYDKFTPEFILMHDLDENTMVYGKVGKSFMMPTFTQLYGGGNIRGAENLMPSTGTHYELGW
uniref:TonB-dependent receptor plug domain-containing protein n=1 Tax=Eshraghiella crossota TaxID=45851 RepID=UPI0040296E1D